MMPSLVWGAPGLPQTTGDHQEVEMASRKIRITSLFVLLGGALVLMGFVAPGAFGQTYTAAFITDPTSAVKNQVITGSPLNAGGDTVTVQVSSPTEDPVGGLTVTLEFAEGSASTTNISGNQETTDESGFAEFPALTIGEPNEPTLTDYQFEAVVSAPIITIGAAFAADPPFSDPFDIWEAGDSCDTGETCEAVLRGDSEAGGADTYKLFDPGTLGASELASSEFPFDCPGQREVFGNSVFTNMTTDADTPNAPAAVFLDSQITAADFRSAGANFGRSHVNWCVALESSAPWIKNGGSFREVTVGSQTFFVGLAPRCPNKKTAPSFAPCILSRMSDGLEGAFIRGWLPGGDPPRRT
jgi:hypothetical protein